MREDVLALLRRRPDVEARDLVAVDATDRLLLDEADAFLRPVVSGPAASVAVLGDAYGALTLALAAEGVAVRSHQDSITAELALRANAAALAERGLLDSPFVLSESVAEAVAGADVVLLRLPRSLDALDAVAAVVATEAPGAVLLAGGRIKHMSLSMNDLLRRRYDRLDVSHARQKSRVLLVRSARADQPAAPATASRRLEEIGLTVVAEPGVFAGARLDIGTRALLAALASADLPQGTLVDLGCGTGVLAAWLATARPDARIVATDSSRTAVASASATAQANGSGDRIEVLLDDNASTLPDASVDAIVCNPPFHSDGAVTDLVARRMIRAAARVLRPGGEMWTVFNSHLSHPATLRRAVGPTEVVRRDGKFTVTRSVRDASAPDGGAGAVGAEPAG